MESTIFEGSKVAFCGNANRDGLSIGDEGKVLMANGNAVHVMMTTGSRKDSAVLLSTYDLSVIATARSSIEDSLYDGTIDESNLSTVAVRNVYDRGGEKALIVALANNGDLPNFEKAAEDAIIQLALQVRNNPIIRSVISHLEEDEAQSFINKVALSAIDDVLGE